MVELGQAGSHLSAAGAWSSHDHQRLCSFNVLILSISLVADDKGYIGWIPLNDIVAVNLDSEILQLLFKEISAGLS